MRLPRWTGLTCWRSARRICRARSASAASPSTPRLVAAIDRVREAVKNGAGARLALPLNHAAFPRNAAQLRELGAGYTNCAPTPEARLLRSLSEQAAEQRKLLGY